jgi:hypothetical protein
VESFFHRCLPGLFPLILHWFRDINESCNEVIDIAYTDDLPNHSQRFCFGPYVMAEAKAYFKRLDVKKVAGIQRK